MKRITHLLLATMCFGCSSENILYVNDVSGIGQIGPYSQAAVSGQFIFTSGQLGLDPANNKLEEGIKAQTKRALDNLTAVLAQSGSDRNHVLKITIYLTDITYFTEMNTVYATYFISHKPVRTTIQVAGLPQNALIEIECIAVKPH